MTKGQIYELIEIGNSLKIIAQSYSEIASLKLKTIRSRVEKNRQFYDEITQVYSLINKIALSKGISLPAKPKKTVSLLLTSNYRFYGNINNELVKFFMIQNTKISGDKLVVGRTGSDFLNSIHYFHSFEMVNFKADFPTDSELKNLIFKLQPYKQVLIFYPEFKSVLIQKPIIRDITLVQSNSLKQETKLKPSSLDLLFKHQKLEEPSFIFEPEILKMLDFFDRQIKILLLEQTILEAELARTASRLIAMDQAQNRANDFIKDNNRSLAQLKRSTLNARVLETIAGLTSLNMEPGTS